MSVQLFVPRGPSRRLLPRSARRVLTALVATTAAVALTFTSPGVASAASTRDPADASAGWLGRQLNGNGVIAGQFGPDYGLTADVVLALDSAKVGRTAAGRATHALKRQVVGYTGGGDPTEYYAGSFAKLLVVAAAMRTDPRHFGWGARRDLVFQLRKLECGGRFRSGCPGGDRGRYSDKSKYGDFSNTITQSLAIVGLTRATGNGSSHAAIWYLRKQQCGNGAFPLEISTAGCKPSVDGTGFAVQALLAAGGGTARVAARRAGAWLARTQNGNGSFTGNGSQNANSTALAEQALRLLGRTAAADKANAFLRSLQLRCWFKPVHRGQIRYDRAGSADAVRATAQAVPALAKASLLTVSRVRSSAALPTMQCR